MSNLNIQHLRELTPNIICIGSYPKIIQSMLDFDYLAGREAPSVIAIIATGRKSERYFFGPKEISLPVFSEFDQAPQPLLERANLVLCLSSGRRVKAALTSALTHLPNLIGGSVFAEGLPEQHAIELAELCAKHSVWISGGASVGVTVPGSLKLGAIGGTQAAQLESSRLMTPGSVAVISTSGGMVNEIIRNVASSGHAISFGLAIGGERYPLLSPKDAFLAAEADTQTTAIAYFGELGGRDEYELADLLAAKQVTKPVIAYVAGTVAELFEDAPQFGHAKAMAKNVDESASAKAKVLSEAGAHAASSFNEFITAIHGLPGKISATESHRTLHDLTNRKPSLISSSISYDNDDGSVQVLGDNLLDLASNNSFANIVGSMLLGRKLTSPDTEAFIDAVLRLLVDHGPYVSGAANTIVTARAGRDLVSSLAAGLLTVGPRFGGAINQAANIWLGGVNHQILPAELVEEYASTKKYILGIGHRKYRSDNPDPRVGYLLAFTDRLEHHRFTDFARGVEAITIRKKGNLILNVDGAIAGILLDFLHEKEDYTLEELQALVDAEFFNALFILSRSVGFMAHYFDQKRLDEGLFRLRPSDVTIIE